ncbi:MAG: ATP-binding protein [Pyrinomonadaceae bacterium MAG19_C2-C3]|nr:ATP-binding protein [Pyrinomonadaceae bacterium MAG19_C2-C3]
MNTANAKLQVVGGNAPGDEELRRWLENHIADHPHLTTLVLSRATHIGMGRTALDAYLNGTYFLPKEVGGHGVKPHGSNVEKQIRAYREKVEGTVRHGYANTFVETRSWMQLQQACHTAITENVIVVVYGKPGVGKSRCMTEYATRKMTTPPIAILCSANVTTRYFVQRIAQSVGLDDKPVTAKLEDNIAEKLKRNPRPLFVDQANYLNEKALGTICHLWEIARVPVVLAGTKDLYELFNTSRLTEDVRAQLASRVAMHYPLAELSKGEVKALIQRVLGDEATDETVAQILNATNGIHRHVDMMLPRILELKQRNQAKLDAGDVTISDIVMTAGRRLMAS